MNNNFNIAFVILIELCEWSLSLPNSNFLTALSNNGIGQLEILIENKTGASDIPTPLIVGGVEARPNEFPWLVNIQGNGLCGGTLIDMDLVLTASHCFFDKYKLVSHKKLKVTAGDHRLNSKDPFEQIADVYGYIIHGGYDADTFMNDIALIKLTKNFSRTSSVYPIALSQSSGTGTRGTVAGWGTLYFDGSVSNVLRKVDVPIVTGQTCNRYITNSNTQFCAGATGKDSCQGDSGGALICNNNQNAVCGIVSFGDKCALAGKPGVYTKVSNYVDWVNRTRYLDFSSSTTLISSRLLLIALIFTSFLYFS